ncbi:MAG TPA: hypothetical protein VKS82_24860 [Streptosporangiaceae bacterium]|nr:hypothetical protein [Streptosporangiaceae bacterium]
MNASTGSVLCLLQERSCRRHRPRLCSSLPQPGTRQLPRASGRIGRRNGAASNSSQPAPAASLARRQPSQRR